jgi:hypothetical protein
MPGSRKDRPYWAHSDPNTPADDERRCARGPWCASAELVQQPDGSFARQGKTGPRAYCDRDRGVILSKLGDLPGGYDRLGEEMEELRAAGSALRMPFGPKLPLHEGMDALRSEMARTLVAWHARVAGLARLSMPDAEALFSRPRTALARSVAVLCAETHIDTLLGLQPGWMTRYVPVALRGLPEVSRDPIARPRHRVAAADWRPDETVAAGRRFAPLPPEVAQDYADCEIVSVGPGSIKLLVLLDGADAGLDIFSLHRRCQRLLGEVAGQAEILEGVPCRECEDFALERAEPPSDPAREAMYSVCWSCRHHMDLDTYRAWAAWYSRWADGARLECRRCHLGMHETCEYGRCQCEACAKIPAA